MSHPLSVQPAVQAAPGLPIDPRAVERGLSCVHCGLCLPSCPTYAETGLEAESPRGRIQLMLGLASGQIQASDSVRKHLDLCLDCRGCETACPSGVVYHELLEETRARLAPTAPMTLKSRILRWFFFHVLTHPFRLRLALLPVRILQKLGLFPLLRKFKLFGMLSGTGGPPVSGIAVQSVVSDLAQRHGRAARATLAGLLTGCVGEVLFGHVNQAAKDLLQACGAEVVVPKTQNCCGAIHHHGGAHSPAMELARKNIDAFMPLGEPGVDRIVSTAAGCGAMLREYDLLLRDDPAYADRANKFVARVRDISEMLLELGLPEMTHPIDATVTYHDACHLAHAQKVTAAPRKLLEQVPGLKLIPLPESDMCCGAAGTYNLTQPEMSAALAGRKLQNIAHTGADICATGNVGCSMQIQAQALAEGKKLRVVHPAELLHRAVFGDKT